MASKCADCAWRKRSEANPKSFMARIWRWHTKVCPGWRAYQKELAEQQPQPPAQPQQEEEAQQQQQD